MWQRTGIILTVVFGFGAIALAEDSGELLWEVYRQGSEDKQQILSESQRRVQHLQKKADELVEDDTLSRDVDFVWLSEHRIPAGLVIERELREVPEGAYLKVLLRLGGRIGSNAILSRLPELLDKTQRHASKVEIMRVMVSIGSDRYVETLREYLRGVTSETSEDLIVEAARGLGQAGNSDDVELLKKCGGWVTKPAGRVKVLVARHRCGDETVKGDIVRRVEDSGASNQLRAWLISYLGEQPYNEGVMALEDLAMQADNRRIGEAALEALFKVRRGLAAPVRYDINAGEGEKQKTAIPLSLEEARKQYDGEMSGKDRQKIVGRIVEMWVERRTRPNVDNQATVDQRDNAVPLQ